MKQKKLTHKAKQIDNAIDDVQTKAGVNGLYENLISGKSLGLVGSPVTTNITLRPNEEYNIDNSGEGPKVITGIYANTEIINQQLDYPIFDEEHWHHTQVNVSRTRYNHIIKINSSRKYLVVCGHYNSYPGSFSNKIAVWDKDENNIFIGQELYDSVVSYAILPENIEDEIQLELYDGETVEYFVLIDLCAFMGGTLYDSTFEQICSKMNLITSEQIYDKFYKIALMGKVNGKIITTELDKIKVNGISIVDKNIIEEIEKIGYFVKHPFSSTSCNNIKLNRLNIGIQYKKIFTGDEEFEVKTTTDGHYSFRTIINELPSIMTVNNYYKVPTRVTHDTIPNNSIYIFGKILTIRDDTFYTLTDYKNYLKRLYEEGNPLVVFYGMSTTHKTIDIPFAVNVGTSSLTYETDEYTPDLICDVEHYVDYTQAVNELVKENSNTQNILIENWE